MDDPDDPDDPDRAARALHVLHIAHTHDGDRLLALDDATGMRADPAVVPRLRQRPAAPTPYNGPGRAKRTEGPAPGVRALFGKPPQHPGPRSPVSFPHHTAWQGHGLRRPPWSTMTPGRWPHIVPTPLRNHLITRSRNPADLLNAATRLFGGSITTSPLDEPCGGDHELRGVAAPDFAVGYFASPLDVRVASTEGRDRAYFVNIGVSGAISASCGGLRATLDEATAGVANPGDTQELRPLRSQRTRFLGLRIAAALVDREFAALTGHPPVSAVRFDFALDLAEAKGRAVRLLVGSLLEQLDSGDPLFQREELRRSQVRCLVTALLLAQPHSHTGELHGGPQPGYPRSLRAALAFIEANLAEHIGLGDIADAAGCSPRTLGSAFRDRLGLSPMSYVRNLRLDRIREDILASDDPVGTIAYRWGVSHLGRFAGEYRDRFAELPSHTAIRR
ncbi:helix-turn-helix transcriptional regulator [Embleya hyalina]|uniref:Transcriptional regulator n=1 Tax=Embleya hyalina TaxID=516124 RepID=A0A401Z1Y8_9ACTN|nr:AraC family transcriptional regulator [Embleya hyalina]GCE00844.1 transcriptional regulator [Embleya hyalina]